MTSPADTPPPENGDADMADAEYGADEDTLSNGAGMFFRK